MSFMEDDDDDFGDLYTDVLLQFNPTSTVSSQPPPSSISLPTPSKLPSQSDLNNPQIEAGDILSGPSNPKSSSFPSETLSSGLGQSTLPGLSIDLSAENRNNDGNKVEEEAEIRVSPKMEVEEITRVKSEPCGSPDIKVEKRIDDRDGVFMEKGDNFTGEVKMEEVELDENPVIPGLSSSPSAPPVSNYSRVPENMVEEVEEEESNRGSKREDDWEEEDSDSEDDLQIVLNSEPPEIVMNENEDEDGEDLVILADGNLHHHPPTEEQDLGEDSTKPADGERKENGEGAKPNGLMMVNSAGPRPIYNNQGFHPHHSQFKYVRPGGAPVAGGPVAGPGGVQSQFRPPVVGPLAGAGRGDWRPRPGFGFNGWSNNSSGAGYGRGLDFTLPSHKTIYEVDIDIFEDKRWGNPGIDISEFFNFGLNEDSWKDYCKKLEQLRLEATMQSKIRVYESGPSGQDYDPDLPPELAAAASGQDFTAENAHKADGQGDLAGEGRGAVNARSMLPTGRAIQVEGGYGERLPSIDTRQPRMRDSDAIIEIVLQDSNDDDMFPENGTSEQLDTELQGEDVRGDNGTEEDIEQVDHESFNHLPYNGKKEMEDVRDPVRGSVLNNIHEGDGILPFPVEAPLHHYPGSRGRGPVYNGGSFGAPHDGRRPQGTERDRYPPSNSEDGNDIIPNQGAPVRRSYDNVKDKLGRSSAEKRPQESSPPVQSDISRVQVAEQEDDMHTELANGDTSARVDGDEIGRDAILANDINEGGGEHRSVKKHLICQVEQPVVHDVDETYELKATRSSDNSRARSESSRDYQKKRNDSEEEVVQEERARRMGELRGRRDEDEHNFRKRPNGDRDGRLEADRNMVVKGREDSYYSHRDSYHSSVHHPRTKTMEFEMQREIYPVGTRQRRDEDAYRVKDEGTRKPERVEEVVSRHRNKFRESESTERDEHYYSKKRLEESEWSHRHEKMVVHSQRNRDDSLTGHREILNNPPIKRRKNEEHRRRELVNEEEYFHGVRSRDGTSRRKWESGDYMDVQRREDRPRISEKPDDQHFVRHKEESWRERERDDWQRIKQPHEDRFAYREKEEGKGALRSSRLVEDKTFVGIPKSKDETRDLGSEKEFKDKKRQTEQSKRRDREVDATLSQHKRREDIYTSENYSNNDDRNPRHERSSKNNDNSVNNRQWSLKERTKETSKSKESEGDDPSTMSRSKRKHEESARRNVKVSTKEDTEQASDSIPASGSSLSRVPGQSLSKKIHLGHEVLPQDKSSRNYKENASSDDERRNSRRRQSKQESILNDKERNRAVDTKTKETNKNRSSLAINQPDESAKKAETVDNQRTLPSGEDKVGETEKTRSVPSSRDLDSSKAGGEDGSHLDTVAKLKKRSERFKLPMPSEKETPATGNKKIDNEVVIAQSEAPSEAAEVKPERPARKRRWTSG